MPITAKTRRANMKKGMMSLLTLSAILTASLVADAATEPTTAKTGKTMNVMLATLGSGVQADFVVSEKLTVGPAVSMLAGGYTVGAVLNYMFSAPVLTDGWSLNSKLSYSPTDSGYSLAGLSQYNAFWENGVNVNAGIGLAYIKQDLAGLRITGVLPALGFNVGYAF
jgi:hypothetical protein